MWRWYVNIAVVRSLTVATKRRRGKRLVRRLQKLRRLLARLSIIMTRTTAMTKRMEDPELTAPPQMCFTTELWGTFRSLPLKVWLKWTKNRESSPLENNQQMTNTISFSKKTRNTTFSKKSKKHRNFKMKWNIFNSTKKSQCLKSWARPKTKLKINKSKSACPEVIFLAKF